MRGGERDVPFPVLATLVTLVTDARLPALCPAEALPTLDAVLAALRYRKETLAARGGWRAGGVGR
ncbi:hypothetical protein EDD38_7212 [Kitasatospora cineracea]|uniref:Uncharacterized protein n=1 Tax=Kitasatospora cineracea TaxID=88074 RepID=A0A3N4R969_9ACTN|nr:hypothetical protein EDD38_7212 [Kitasatospora cineracea]